MLAYALYAQYGLGLEPCPLCIFQRVTIFALGVFFLAAALQHPRGAPLEVMLRYSPFTDVVRKVLAGGGECSQVNWSFAGLAMPAWVLVAALVLGIAGVVANSRQ